ncbi:MAG: glycoside hydrolase family 3 C-terminal domain-containing protein [Pseudomonadota bacterium]
MTVSKSAGRRATHRTALVNIAILLCALTGPLQAAAADNSVHIEVEQRVEQLLSTLTQREKILLMSGGSSFGTASLTRAGIPALNLADGPNGVRSNDDEQATAFPTGVALAATWDPDAAQAMGEAIGREARALGVHVLLGPNVNIQRTPLAGRNFETYSEDPFLAGKLGVGFVRGVQSQGVGTSPKHFVANEQELERLRGSSNMDMRTLREIYLAPFEMIVREAKPWTVMASYNRLNGVYVTDNAPLLRGILKGEWGFDGVLMSDWGAVHSTAEAANAGVDLEMPGPPRYFGSALYQAARVWQVEQGVIDEAARRMLRLIVRTAALDTKSLAGRAASRSATSSDANRAAALRVAEEAIALLKNERGLLPLDRAKIKRLAVIGPNADVPLIQGGGSASVVPSRFPTPLAALQDLAKSGVAIRYAQGVDNDLLPPPADYRLFSPDQVRKQQGLKFAYYNSGDFTGSPTLSGVEINFDKTMIGSKLPQMSARWEGWLWPQRDGRYEFSLAARGLRSLQIDGKEIIGEKTGTQLPADSDFVAAGKLASITLAKGRGYRIRVDYVSGPGSFHAMHLGMRLPEPSLDEAVQAARDADAAIVMVGVSRTSESEGRDRRDMELVGRQNELVEAVLAANPNTVVVLHNGAPLALPWVDKAPAIIEAWLPGQEGDRALARLLFGEANPSGKLPFTFPRRIEDNPSYLHYSGGRDANYGEGVFVGYRYYDKKKVAPLFAFGHGLSYTQFEYSNLRVPVNVAAAPIEVSVDVRNTGKRAGTEVVQLYVADEATTDVVRPAKELKGFARVTLAPGESKTVKFSLSARDLAYYDVHVKDWISTPGAYSIHVGSSSADIRQKQAFRWTAEPDPRLPNGGRVTASEPF